MLSDYKPVIFDTPREFDEVELYFISDVHKASAEHRDKKWEKLKSEILSQDNRYVIMAGDYCENAVIGGKSDIYTQKLSPFEQKEWLTEQLHELADRVVVIVPGNHETNRITKTVGLYPVYDSAMAAGIGDRYRQHFGLVDIGVGESPHGKGAQNRYFGYIAHRARNTKAYTSSDFIDGIDFAAYGHDHAPGFLPRSKLVYDPKLKTVSEKDIAVIDAGAFLSFGGYGADKAYRPLSKYAIKAVLSGKRKTMTLVGFVGEGW